MSATIDNALPTLPEGWEWHRVADLTAPEPRALTDGPFGSNLKTEHYTDSGPRVIRLQNIGDGEFIDAEAHISEERFELLRSHEARAGDIVLASLGEELPRACLVPEWLGPAIVKADCPRLRPHPDHNPAYLVAALNSPWVRHQAAAVIHGVGRPRLKLAELKKLRVPLPARAEQDAIVEELEHDLSMLRDGVRAFGNALHGVVQYRAAVLRDALDGNWPRVALKDALISLRNGIFVSRPGATPPGIPIYRISAVRPLALNVKDVRYAPLDLDDHERFLVQPGDLLFTRYSGNAELVGACARVPAGTVPALHPDKLIRGVVDRSKAEPEFLELACSAGETWREIRAARKTTAGQVGIAGSQLAAVSVPLPSLEVQREVIADCRRQLAASDALERDLCDWVARVDPLKRAVLRRAVTPDPSKSRKTDRAVLAAE